MNWWDVTAGAVAGLVLQNVAYPSAQSRYERWRKRQHFRAAERASRIMEERFGSLVLVQAGWGEDGTFNHDAVTLELGGDFDINDPRVTAIRDQHRPQWLSDGLEDGQQVGIATLRISRVSDRPEDDRAGRSHRIACQMHVYGYFSFLATHRLLLTGDAEEREVLKGIAGEPNCAEPIHGFPNPFSVGLSVFCEDGDYLALTRRTTSIGAGGDWHGGKVFNAVGENAAPRDFSPGLDGTVRSTPYLIAQRGLREELGLPMVEIDASEIRLHSLAYAIDLRDHKFFGYVLTRLSRSDLQDAWRHAPDRTESTGSDLDFHSVQTEADTRRLLRRVVDEAERWAPEAVFCAIRSVLVRRLLPPAEVSRILRSRR
ncbi:hypothetical protein ACQP26_09470 [Micromonospora sp. CA-248089]|uniref:hypothetical protein n=1 Tax=Micromonospora sp. CA-248089 TaxID=3239960 RepID=UPI003D8D2787